MKRQRKISEDLEIEEEEMTDGNDDECYLCDGIDSLGKFFLTNKMKKMEEIFFVVIIVSDHFI